MLGHIADGSGSAARASVGFPVNEVTSVRQKMIPPNTCTLCCHAEMCICTKNATDLYLHVTLYYTYNTGRFQTDLFPVSASVC